MKCPACHNRIEHGGRQCQNCGTEIDTGTTDEMTSLYPQPVTGRLEYAFILPGKQAAPDRTSRPDPGPVPLGAQAASPVAATTTACRRCRSDLAPAARFCSGCGARTETNGFTKFRRRIFLAADSGAKKIAASLVRIGTTELIVLGGAAFCLFAGITGIFAGLGVHAPPDEVRTTLLLARLDRVEWLVFAVFILTLGRYFKRA